jgi:putative transposase
LYFRFCLSYRDVEELLFARGIIVTYEAIRKGCCKFGQAYANELRRWRPSPGDKWHLDEVFLTIHGARHYLWRAVDQDGYGLDMLMQSRRNKHAAKKFFRKLLKGLRYVPRVLIMDKLQSYGAAKREILLLSAYGPIAQHFRPRRHRFSASDSRQEMQRRFDTWQALTTLPTAAYASRPEAVMPLLAW